MRPWMAKGTAQFEHNLVTSDGVEVLTARSGSSPGGPIPMPPPGELKSQDRRECQTYALILILQVCDIFKRMLANILLRLMESLARVVLSAVTHHTSISDVLGFIQCDSPLCLSHIENANENAASHWA
ncbi:hypothetical protein LMH87_007521 [Akanthomyces muscarius]|uniref:Uncharacterized protein n=1 Tax=Akanthomyces muscarius TaxID=2231603 RepID=A0A9W8QPU8_AKAMU|nr:hypothetical protein LMH87_007521 [Akanthomyces muscarius]KAJ4165918.1 hypothetical protein LMH87_007521 [Akanthomyces muscarius]